MRKDRTISMRKTFLITSLTPIILFLVLCAGVITLSILYATYGGQGLLIALIVYSAVVLPILIVSSIISFRFFRRVYVHGLIDITKANGEKLRKGDPELLDYPETKIEEIRQLNEQNAIIRGVLRNSMMVAAAPDFSNISFEYDPEFPDLIVAHSLWREIVNLILASCNFRNVFLELYYDMPNGELTPEDVKYLSGVLRKRFGDYEGVLYAIGEDRKSLYVFLPRIDSFSVLRSHMEDIAKSCTISRRLTEGLTYVPAHVAAICYPYSRVGDFHHDLQYAKRQNKAVNLYLPNRLHLTRESELSCSAINLNIMSRLLSLGSTIAQGAAGQKDVRSILKYLTTYLNADQAGLIAFDTVEGQYFSSIHNGKSVRAFEEGAIVETKLVAACKEAADDDGSYYFSSRRHAAPAVGEHADRYGIQSGFTYAFGDGETTLGLLYLFKANGSLQLDSYLQESLSALFQKLGDYELSFWQQEDFNETNRQANAVMKLANYASYRINRKNHALLGHSESVTDFFGKPKIGQPCYKTLYGLDAPCADCPLATGKKKTTESGHIRFETALTLEDKKETAVRLFVRALRAGEEAVDRYNRDFLIHSFKALTERVGNYFTIGGRGALTLLRIDSLNSLIEEQGSEGALGAVRAFLDRVRRYGGREEDIYFYDSRTIAFLYPAGGQIDTMDKTEHIYELSKRELDGTPADQPLTISYISFAYPGGFASSDDFLRNVDRSYRTAKNLKPDYLLFADSGFLRPASRTEYMLQVIDAQFGDESFQVMYQPIVEAKTKRVSGAELLLRVADDTRNIVFNADELVRIAAAHDKIGLISHALLNRIGSLYESYGISVFKNLEFANLRINTDYSFFADTAFFNNVMTLIREHHLPHNFVGFEVTEADINNHLEEFKDVMKQVHELNAMLICDRYTGKYLSLDTLKNLGFNEVKLDRYALNHIDSDSAQRKSVTSLMEEAKARSMKITLVGIENVDQYHIVRAVDPNCMVQGYHFYRPLDKQGLIQAIRESNGTLKD